MQVSQAFDMINQLQPHQIETFAVLLPLELIEQAYALTETVTLRKRKLTLESMACFLLEWLSITISRWLISLICLISLIEREKHLWLRVH